MTDNYNQLISKLDQFTRKYYINRLIKGILYTTGLVLLLFLLFNVLEYYFYFGKGTRKLFFYSFVGISLISLLYWVITPITKYLRLGKTISHEQAASIIGDHFGDVKDKLLNVLQLKKQSIGSSQMALIDASINQKTAELTPVPFKSAIDLSKNRKYAKYALPPFLALLVILFAAPSIIKEGTHRIINNNEDFEKAAPFHFKVENSSLDAIQYEDFTVDVSVDGEVLPNEAFLEIDGFRYKLEKIDNSNFSYTFRNIQKDTKFKLVSGSVKSKETSIKVLEKPNLNDFRVDLRFPSYTGRRNETLQSIGDMLIPEGTSVKWNFEANNTDNIRFSFNRGKLIEAERKDDNLFQHTARIKNDQAYKLYISNNLVPMADSLAYTINVVKDQFPTISVEEFRDSVNNNLIYFVGNAADDYGLSSLSFNYNIVSEDGKTKGLKSVPIKKSEGRETQYDYILDIEEIGLNAGENISYYFQVYDNDGVNGAKPAKTGVMTYAKPSFKEFKEQENENEEEIKDKLKESTEDIDKLQEKFKKMREKLLQEKELDWQDKKEMEKLIEDQKKLQEKLEKAKEKFDENMKNQEEFQKPNEQIQEKQEKLKQMFEEAMDPEQKEMLDKIQELMQELEKEDAMEMMEQFEMDNENMKKSMERLEELYKQLEMEKEVNEQIEKLEELAEEQEKLAEETKEEKKSDEELKKEQEELNKEFEEVKEKMEELEKKNDELSPPKDLGEDNEEKMEDIQEDMEKSEESLESGENQKASESQKKAAEKMKKMAGSLQSSMQGGDQEQQQEDIKAIRQLLENIVTVSFDQEELTEEFSGMDNATPKFVELVQQQFKLKDDFKIIEDSLTALAMRNDKIETFVTEKVTEVKYNMSKSIDLLEARQEPKAIDNQRRTMTNLNDLALMLSESMENMQQSMSSGMPGSQMCNKPGGKSGGKSGKVPSDKISQGQKGMGEQLKKLGEKANGQSGEGGKPSAKDFAEAAARQAALRKALEEQRDSRGEEGKGAGELQGIIDQMDKMEKDLVNKRFDAEMLERQQDILTRLLEAEKADRQREFDNKRKAEVGKEMKKEMPAALQEYLKKRQAEVEMFKSTSPALRPHYKYLVDKYYNALKNSK